MRRVHFSPRSLRQLVLIAFMLVIAPLIFLASRAYLSLDSLSTEAAHINQLTLNDAKRSENMTSLALSMERSYRQYCVLKDDSLNDLYQDQYGQYRDLLTNHSFALDNHALYEELTTLLGQLKEIQCINDQPIDEMAQSLQRFSAQNSKILQVTQDMVFSRSANLEQSIAKQGTLFQQMTIIVLVVSFLLVMYFTRRIIEPVNTVNEMITLLGEGKFIERVPAVKGPLELEKLVQRICWLSDRRAWLEAQRYQFLRHISHELKTPLASLREGTELLADQIVGPLTKDQLDVVGILDTSSLQLQRLIEQLLDYNRRLADTPDEKKEIDLTQLIRDIISAHSLPAKAKEMTTQSNLQVTHYWGEEALLTKVIDNLYSNAVHYGAESGLITITSQQVGDDLQILVANTGDAILDKDKPMLFEPFYQGHQQRKGAVKGSGLGLSIAQDCIYRMKGELTLIDVDDADVCFRIVLPNKK